MLNNVKAATQYPEIKLKEFKQFLSTFIRAHGGVYNGYVVLTDKPMEYWMTQCDFGVSLVSAFPIFQPIFELMASSVEVREKMIEAFVMAKLGT